MGLTNNLPLLAASRIIAAAMLCLGSTFVSLPATVGCTYNISPSPHVSSPTAMLLATLPLVSIL